jgi:hypothetical protein
MGRENSSGADTGCELNEPVAETELNASVAETQRESVEESGWGVGDLLEGAK